MTVIPYRAGPDWPPVPAASVVVTELLGVRAERVSAKIDTGSFMTVVPRRLLERIQANRTSRERLCAGYDSFGVDGPAEVLLGRDVLSA